MAVIYRLRAGGGGLVSDLAIDFATGDLALSDAGDFYLVESQRATAQHLWVRLRLIRGEWFLDQREGVPYFDDILVAGPDLNVIEATYRQTILATPGIEAITHFALNFDRRARSLSLVFEARTSDGSTVSSADYGVPFIVTAGG